MARKGLTRLVSSELRAKGDGERRHRDPKKSGPDRSWDVQRPCGRTLVCAENSQGGRGKGSVRKLREVIREVRGQGTDLALTLGRIGSEAL